MNPSTTIPPFLQGCLEDSFSEEWSSRIVEGLSSVRPTTLRANTLKTDSAQVASDLDALGIPHEKLPWYGDGFILNAPKEAIAGLRESELYTDGRIYLQNPSTMLPALVLDPQPGEDILDMCAAPGGKTTQICALAKNEAYVTACEMNAPRAEKLRFNLERQGARNVSVLRTDARQLDPYFSFDRILLDAPCTGSGTVHLDDPKLEERLTDKLLAKTTKAQRALLSKALEALRPGGTLVYSTCSILPAENEKAIEDALANTKDPSRFRIEPVVLPPGQGPTLLPGRLEGSVTLCPDGIYEGFFLAKVVRTR